MPVTTQKKGSILLINGLDVSKPGEYISEQATPAVQNFRVDRGLLTKRVGTAARGSAIGGTDKEILHGREFTREGTKYNVRIGRDNIENYNSGTSSWDDITGSALTGSTNDLVDTAVPLLSGKRILCITNGIDAIRKWTGTGNTAALGGTPPVAKFIQEYQTYLVCANIAGGTDVSQRVQWSHTANPETWDSGNAGSKDLVEDGEDITGLNLFGGYLCVHKPTSIYLGGLVSTTSIFRFDRKSTEVGTIANGSIVNLPTGEQIFLAKDGLRLFNGVRAPLIDAPVNDEIRDELNLNTAHKAWGVLVLEEDEVWIGVPLGSQTVGETVYKFNYKTRVLYKDTRANINAVWRASESEANAWDDASGTWDASTDRWNSGQLGTASGEIHFGDTSGNTTIKDTDADDDNGTAIDARWQSKDYQDQEFYRLLRWQEILMWFKGSGTFDLEYSTDGGSTWNVVSGSPFTLSGDFPADTSPMRGYLDVLSTKNRFRITHDGAGTLICKQFVISCVQRELI
ncbi:MAG: hypothetical protein DRJ03_03525 [Chloroflexi bacterium]|nr:MAG: hypothetical protein DRJ03_03525 [Chloroflexota bacterium]